MIQNQIILYSTNCPVCKQVERMLDTHNIKYVINSNIDEMIQLGFRSAPVLKVDSTFYKGKDIFNWIKEVKK